MRRVVLCLFVAALCWGFQPAVGFAEPLGVYEFTGLGFDGDNDTPNTNGSATPGLTFSEFARVNVTANSGADAFNSKDWNTGGTIDLAEYISFTVTVDAGFCGTLTALGFRGDGSNTVADEGRVSVSTNGFASVIESLDYTVTPSYVDYTFDFGDISVAEGDTVEFRFYIYGDTQADGEGAPSTAGTFRVDDVTLMGAVPFVSIDYPQEDEIITSATYVIRMTASDSSDNVRVKIDAGDWSQCYWSDGHWWFDWSNYPTGDREMIAEAWSVFGQRYETAVRHCSYQPPVPYADVLAASCTLETTGASGTVEGDIYLNTNGLTFNFNAEVESFEAGTEAWLQWSPVDGEGGWYDISTNAIALTETGATSNGVLIEGSVSLSDLDIPTRHEFVVRYEDGARETVWLKPFHHEAGTNGVASYDLGPSAAHPSEGDLYNGFFIPLETPHVTIDFPTENEVIESAVYTIRLGAGASTNNALVRIDGGEWSQCRFEDGYWWFDWADYDSGAHEIIAEGWNILGQRTETDVRHCTYNPSGPFGNIYDVRCTLETTGEAGLVEGEIYINTNGLVFNFTAEMTSFDPDAEAWLIYSPTYESNWYDVNSNAIPLNTNGITSNGVIVEGSVSLSGLELMVRHEFVVAYETGSRATIWLKPFTYSVGTNGVASYDLGPDVLHPADDDLYNGFFTPLTPPGVNIIFPNEGETIVSPDYTIQMYTNESTNNVRVKIDTGDWSQCYFAYHYWWFDWSSYSPGDHEIIAESWNILGQRYETPVRNCTYDPAAAYGGLVDATCTLETSGASGSAEGDIYINTTGLTFRFTAEATSFDAGAEAWLRWSPVDGEGGWYDVNSNAIAISQTGVTSNGVMIEGTVSLSGLEMATRHEFVVRYDTSLGQEVWLKPFHYEAGTNGVIWYDLGADATHPAEDDLFNGFFIPLDPPAVNIDFPTEGETIVSPWYTIRMSVNESVNNVRIKIDAAEEWDQCRLAIGYWWFDWAYYETGAHTIIVEAWNILGQRVETPVRNCTYQPGGPWIDPDPAVAGEEVTVYYNPVGGPLENADPVYLHYGFNNWTPFVGDVMMTTNGPGSIWKATVSVPSYAQLLDVTFWDGDSTWAGTDWQFTVTGGWSMDGNLDASATMVSSNGGLHLYAGVIGDELYIAVEDAGEGNDHFIFVANPPGALTAAPWSKAGQVAQWDAYLADENDNDYEGWGDAEGTVSSASGYGDGYLEGTINLVEEYGSMPTQIYLAMGPYETPDGGALQYDYQVPSTTNSDGNVDADEYVLVNICDIRVTYHVADFDQDCDVDLDDYAVFADCLNGPGQPAAGTCPVGVSADFDEDGDVDLTDFAAFQEHFGLVY
ncbi:MAG: hypothetical protein KAV82_07005 [Phycisphaerae bacterium]|nr:hypothetical protein [Phycisphaerae bacterium]